MTATIRALLALALLLAAGTLAVLDVGGLGLAGPVGLTLRSGQEVGDALGQLMQAVREAATVA